MATFIVQVITADGLKRQELVEADSLAEALRKVRDVTGFSTGPAREASPDELTFLIDNHPFWQGTGSIGFGTDVGGGAADDAPEGPPGGGFDPNQPAPGGVSIEQLGPGGALGAFLNRIRQEGVSGEGGSTAGNFLRGRFQPNFDLFQATEATRPVGVTSADPNAAFENFLNTRGLGTDVGGARSLFDRLSGGAASQFASPGFVNRLRAPTQVGDAISARNLALEARGVSPFLNRFAPSAGDLLGAFAGAGAPEAGGGFLDFIRQRLGGFA